MLLSGSSEVWLGLLFGAAAYACWRFRIDAMNLREVFNRPKQERSAAKSGVSAALLLLIALAALVGGLTSL
jgi:hypothetical protein